MCSKKMVMEHPDVVKRFVDASIKGYATFLHGPHDKAAGADQEGQPRLHRQGGRRGYRGDEWFGTA